VAEDLELVGLLLSLLVLASHAVSAAAAASRTAAYVVVRVFKISPEA
jgi:hypothetical protein